MSRGLGRLLTRSAPGGAAVVAAVLLSSVSAARSEYRLSPGDSLDIAVAGIPDLKSRVAIQDDGSVTFPLLGTVAVAGLSAVDASAKIKAGLAAKVFRQRAPDGRENVTIIEPDQVSATIGELRSVIVNGDVSRPGEQKYRPSMTVREAVALSGGYDTMHFRADGNPFLISAELRGQYEAQWTEFVKEQAAIWRVQNELGRQAQFNQKLLADVPISRTAIAEILQTESEQLAAHQGDFDREEKFIQDKISQTDGHIKVVSDELQKDEQGLAADSQDVQRLKELDGKGLVSMPRMADARRAVLLASTRKLQTASQLMKLQNDRLDLSRQVKRISEQRRSDLLRDLQDRNVRLREIKANLESIEDRLRYTGILKSQLVSGSGDKPDIAVVRKTKSGRQHIGADEDYELEPGDVVEVTLRRRPLDLSSMK